MRQYLLSEKTKIEAISQKWKTANNNKLIECVKDFFHEKSRKNKSISLDLIILSAIEFRDYIFEQELGEAKL